MDNGTKSIVEGDVDLYEFLEASPDANPELIRRLYRKKALQYHPDKQNGDATKFDLLSKIYTILSDIQLREQYDRIRNHKLLKHTRDQELDELTKWFKQGLETKEREQQQKADKSSLKRRRQAQARALQIEGLNKRRKLEAALRDNGDAHISFQELNNSVSLFSLEMTSDPKVVVKWKFKEIIQGKFTKDILEQIMSSFGPVEYVQIWKHLDGDRYNYGTVKFKKIADAYDACQHDYSKSATRWDGTSVRKLASLLRSCEFEFDYKSRSELVEFEHIVEPMLKAKHVHFLKNVYLDKVLYPYMAKELLHDVGEIPN